MEQSNVHDQIPGPAVPKFSQRRQQQIVFGLALAVAAIVGLGALGSYLFASAPESQKKVAKAGSFVPTPAQMSTLGTAIVENRAFRNEVMTDGKIAANGNNTTPVFSPYSGRVVKLAAAMGDSVRKGQVLIEIEASESVQTQNDLIAAVATLDTTRAQLTQSELLEKRKHALFEAKGGSLQDWQQSQADLVVAQSNVRAAETTLALARNKLRILGRSDAEINGIETSRKIRTDSAVVAPINGTVTDRQVGLGQFIQAGASNPIFSISNLSTVWLVGNVRESDAPRIRKGMPVEVRALAYPSQPLRAKLTYVSPVVDPATRRVQVRAEVENPDNILKPEMYATFTIYGGSEQTAPAIPESAIVYDGEIRRVWVVEADKSLSLREVRTGRAAGGMVEAILGVKAGERLVTSGTLFIDRAATPD